MARNRLKKHVPLEQLNIPPMGSKPSRTKQKKLLQESASREITDEEAEALTDAFFNGHPLVAAILGQCMVEYELDGLLRFALKKTDDRMWKKLVEQDGPLGTFYRKTTFASALGLINEATASKLKAIRLVRNRFAHSQRLLSFNDPLILADMKQARFMKSEKGADTIMAFADHNEAAALTAYRKICDWAGAAILRRYLRGLNAQVQNIGRKTKRLEKEMGINPFSFSPSPRGLSGLLGLTLPTGIGDPSTQVRRPSVAELLLRLGNPEGNQKTEG